MSTPLARDTCFLNMSGDGDAWASAVAIQPDGRRIVAGTLGEVQGNGLAPGGFALARYLAD
ncbi:MAG: hypothetical protein ACRDHS_06580 [Actinomycetota bacterium]